MTNEIRLDATDFTILPDGSDRPVTLDNIYLALSARDWMDNEIEKLEVEYSRIFNKGQHGYIQKWDIDRQGNIEVDLDDSRDYSWTLTIPINYLLTSGKERTALMVADKAVLDEAASVKKVAAEKIRITNEIAVLEARLKELKGTSE